MGSAWDKADAAVAQDAMAKFSIEKVWSLENCLFWSTLTGL
jgi:hypothetical protein